MHRAKIITATIAALSLSQMATAGISKNSSIKGGDALLLGGEQPGRVDIDGQNRGDTDIELFIEGNDETQRIAIISPGERFYESVPKDRTFVIQNASDDETADVYWHISRYSNRANARFRTAGEAVE